MTRVTRVTHERLSELLDYDRETGIFRWKKPRSNRVRIGDQAGVVHHPSGGRYISIDNETIMAHRLAWFYEHKRWPQSDVRPIDGNYDHCWISNLKEMSRVELAHQRGKKGTNTSGYVGVSRARFGKFQAAITWNYKQISLGASFESPEDAYAVYVATKKALKAAKTQSEIDMVVRDVKLSRRQRAAWANLVKQNISLGWPAFEVFAQDITEIPERRYSIMPVNASIPIGPGNFKWASAGHEISSTTNRVAYNRANREANRDYYRGKDFKKNYGIDFAAYQRMLGAQRGVCAICEKPESKIEKGTLRLLSVDHDHTTGAVRGLLCGNCNLGLGYFCESAGNLSKAIAYLNRYTVQVSETLHDGRRAD